MNTFTAEQAAQQLDVDVSRVHQWCRKKRLGYTLPRHGRAWVITPAEIARLIEIGDLPSGRPRKTKVAWHSSQARKGRRK